MQKYSLYSSMIYICFFMTLIIFTWFQLIERICSSKKWITIVSLGGELNKYRLFIHLKREQTCCGPCLDQSDKSSVPARLPPQESNVGCCSFVDLFVVALVWSCSCPGWTPACPSSSAFTGTTPKSVTRPQKRYQAWTAKLRPPFHWKKCLSSSLHVQFSSCLSVLRGLTLPQWETQQLSEIKGKTPSRVLPKPPASAEGGPAVTSLTVAFLSFNFFRFFRVWFGGFFFFFLLLLLMFLMGIIII